MKHCFMKKCLSILLSVSLVLPLFSCQTKENPQKLRILVDLFLNVTSFDNEKDLLSALDHFGKLNSKDIEIEFLPKGNPERETRIAALRTEIMAGGGPDVYLLATRRSEKYSRWYEDQDITDFFTSEDWLFPDVNQAIRSQKFLPFDEYVPGSKYFDKKLLHSAALEACSTEEGLVALPITITFPFAIYLEDAVEKTDSFPNSWESAVRSSSLAFQTAYGVAAWRQFSSIFEEIADYSTEKLTFTREELLQAVKEAVLLFDEELSEDMKIDAENRKLQLPTSSTSPRQIVGFPVEKYAGFLREEDITSASARTWNPGYYTEIAFLDDPYQEKAGTQVIAPIRNTAGGVTGQITAYAAINSNTKQPEKAFRVIDTFFYHKVQNGLGEYIADRNEYYSFHFWILDSVPARNDLFQNYEYSFEQDYVSQYSSILPGPNEETFSEYTALRNEVTSARFYGTLDAELQTMYEACLEAKTDEEIEKIVSKAYDTMLMILAES